MFLHDFVTWVQAIRGVVQQPEPLLREFIRLAESPEIQTYVAEVALGAEPLSGGGADDDDVGAWSEEDR